MVFAMLVEEKQIEPAAKVEESLEELPVLTVRDTVIFPGAMLPITVGRPASGALVQSLGENRTIAVVSQLDPRVESPRPEDLYGIGTVCVMHKAIRAPKENFLLFCEGIARIRTLEFTATEPFLRARVERIPDVEPEITPEVEALRHNGRPDPGGRQAGRLGGGQRALAQRRRAPGAAGATRRAHAPERNSPRPDARAGIARAAQPDPIAGAGPAFAEPARVLPARAVESHPKGTGRGRRIVARHRGPAQKAGRRRDERRGQSRSRARANPPLQDVSGLAGVRRHANLPGVDVHPAVEPLLRFAGGREARRRDPGRRSLRPGESEGPYPGLPGRAAITAGVKGADPVLCGAARSGENIAREIHRAFPRPQVRAHLHGRDA